MIRHKTVCQYINRGYDELFYLLKEKFVVAVIKENSLPIVSLIVDVEILIGIDDHDGDFPMKVAVGYY